MIESKIISCQEVKSLLDNGTPDILVLDCHFSPKGDFCTEYKTGHIAGAPHFDVTKASYKTSTVTRELAQPADFQAYARSLGVNNSSQLVLYDRTPGGFLSASRAWFLFGLYGHSNVSIMNGGLAEWKRLQFPVTDEEVTPKAGNFTAAWNPNFYMEHDAYLKFLEDEIGQTLDCRPPTFFNGETPIAGVEGLKGCRIKGAINTPLAGFIADDGLLKSEEEIKKVLGEKGVFQQRVQTTLCNSGMQATGVTFILNKMGYNVRHYNGAYFQLARCNPEMIQESP